MSKKFATSEEIKILSQILALYEDATQNDLNRFIGSIFKEYQAHHPPSQTSQDDVPLAELPHLGELLGMSDEQALSFIHEEVAKSIQEQAPAHLIRVLTKALPAKQKQTLHHPEDNDETPHS